MNFRRIVKIFIPQKLFKSIEPYGHLVEAILFNLIYGFPARSLKVIGVTGTNGKTTTSFLIHKMMHEAGYKVGLMTTVAYGTGDSIQPQIHHMTNVAVPEFMRRLRELKRKNVEWLVLETTSHALAQNRMWGVPYSVAVMTNLTHEHLDWHGTFDNYRNAKMKLFKIVDRNHRGLRVGVINADDPSAKMFENVSTRSLTYGVKKGDLRATNIKATPSGSTFAAQSHTHKDLQLKIKVNLPGSFNVYNALAAASVGFALGMKPKQIEQGIDALKNVEGRMATIDEGQDFHVIVDFAHTPDSFERLLSDMRSQVKRNRLIVLFGQPGRRDLTKGILQGEIAGRYADIVVVTEEDDRDVNGQALMEQVASGAKKAGKVMQRDLFLVHDRTEAISFALGQAKAGDTVMLLGKGHEKTIERADGEHPWDEVGTAHSAVKELVKNRLP